MDRAGARKKPTKTRTQPVTVPVSSNVCVMSWNIHGAHGHNPRFDLERVIALIKEHDPDVIALQEIDSRRPRGRNALEPFQALKDALGTHGVDARAITTIDGDYGQAVISRWPIENPEIHDITYKEREPRRVIRCDVRFPGGPLRVIATHLGLSVRERRGQARKLLMLAGDVPHPTLVIGDFNDWFWFGSVRKVLAAALPARSRTRTFPAKLPLFRFDRIYCRPRAALISATTDRRASALSDHLPVIARIRV